MRVLITGVKPCLGVLTRGNAPPDKSLDPCVSSGSYWEGSDGQHVTIHLDRPYEIYADSVGEEAERYMMNDLLSPLFVGSAIAGIGIDGKDFFFRTDI
jgi:hypothetical protein